MFFEGGGHAGASQRALDAKPEAAPAAAEARAAGLSAVADNSEVARRDALNDLKAVLTELMAGSDQVRDFLARHLVSVEAMQKAKLTTKKQDGGTEKTKVKSTKKLKG